MLRLSITSIIKIHMGRLLIWKQANFLGWHRYYVWAYEKALREECGYQGYQPVSR